MTTSRYIYTKYDINMAIFRFWGDKPQSLIDILHFDTPIGWYVFEGFHRDALAPGFNLVDENNETIDAFDDLDREMLDDVMEKYAIARAESNKHYAVMGMFDFGQGEQLYFLTDRDIIDIQIEPATKNITYLKFSNPTEYYDQVTYGQPIEVTTPRALEKVRLLGRYDRRIGRFRCRYESIVDNMLGLSVVDQQLVLLVIRVGSGLRYAVVKESILSDDEARTELEDTLENMGMNTLMVVPVTDLSEDSFQIKLDFGEGTPPFDWTVARSNLLRGITVRMGVPEEVFNGAEIGMRSAETNHGKWLMSMHREQREMTSDILWILSTVFELDTENADLSWLPFAEPDEETKTTIFMNKMNALQTALSVAEKAGIPLDWLKEQLDLDYDTDEAMIAEFTERRQALQDGLNNPDDNSSTEEDDPAISDQSRPEDEEET